MEKVVTGLFDPLYILVLCLVNCVFVEVSSGYCINRLIDFNNCGKLDNICASNYTNCSADRFSNL